MKWTAFLKSLMKSDKRPTILRILRGYAEKFRPKLLDTPSKSLKNLYFDSWLNITFKDLQNRCYEIFDSISISQEEALNIESQTRSQGKSQKCYELWTGRITASVLKVACRSNLNTPSLSLTKKKYYWVKFRSIATGWRTEHKNAASKCYFSNFSSSRENLTIRDLS